MTAYFDFFLPATLILHLQGVRDICVLFINIIMMDVFVVDFLPLSVTGTPKQLFRRGFRIRLGGHVPTLQRGGLWMVVMVPLLLGVEQKVGAVMVLLYVLAHEVGARKLLFHVPKSDVSLYV